MMLLISLAEMPGGTVAGHERASMRGTKLLYCKSCQLARIRKIL